MHIPMILYPDAFVYDAGMNVVSFTNPLFSGRTDERTDKPILGVGSTEIQNSIELTDQFIMFV